MTKKVLIINFNFPPNGQIGGRRWSFMTQALHNKGIEIFVLSSDFEIDNANDCPWLNCISDFESNIKYLPHKIPYHYLNKAPQNNIGKLKYRYSLLTTKLFHKGNPYDRSLIFSRNINQEIKNIIDENKIKNIIVSVGPFHLSYEISKIKKSFGKNINLIVDYRDPWTDNYTDQDLSNKIKKEEREKQTKSLTLIDTIYFSNIEWKVKMNNVWGNVKKNIKIIPHGYDENLFRMLSKKSKSHEKKIFYAGTIYPNMEHEMDILSQLVSKLDLQTTFYGKCIDSTYDAFNNPLIRLFKPIRQQELFRTVSNYNFSLIIFPNRHKDNKSSKFYELIRFGKFIIYIGHRGIVSDYIVQNNLGYFIDANASSPLNQEMLSDLKQKYEEFIPKPELVKEYSFDSIADKIIEDLI